MSSMNKRTTKMMLSASSLGAGSTPSPKMPLVVQKPWTLARLHGVVKDNVYAFERGKRGVHRPRCRRPTPLRVQFLNERAAITFNACLNAWDTRHYDEFGEDHLGEMVLCPNVSTQAVVQPSECSGSEFPSVPSECYDDDEFSGSESSASEFFANESIPDLQSYEYFEEGAHTEFPIIGEDHTHAEFPDEETMAAAFDNVHMLMPSDGVYMLPTQPGFDMSASSQSTAEYDFGDVAVLNPEDEQALAEQFAEQCAEQLDDPLFEKYMLALIQANGILHAMDGTSPSMEEFFGLQDLINRVFANTATEADRRYVAYLLSIVG